MWIQKAMLKSTMKPSPTRFSWRCFHTSQRLLDMSKIRNIGIMAHIDAGKTTTTERMLFYSGYINRLGEVHTGDTVMDYLEQERMRGITINAAAITLPWSGHQINLIDTPGHVDFTMEVERSLRVMDGALLVLDGSAGVEAQTLTVWRQAQRNNVPRIAYINKLDKPTADIAMTTLSITRRLEVAPLIIHTQLGEGRNFSGLVDLVAMEGMIWPRDGSAGDCSRSYRRIAAEDMRSSMTHTWENACEAREMLVEAASDHDPKLAEEVINAESFAHVGAEQLRHALRRIAINPESKGLVTCLGSSYRNVGVQPLMDAIIHYAPSPSDRHYPFLKYYQGGNEHAGPLCSMVFKIVHHPQKGPLCFVRVYAGHLNRHQASVYNLNRSTTERFSKLMVAFADDYREVEEVTAGNVAVLSGLKVAMTGDTLVQSLSMAKALARRVAEEMAPIQPVPHHEEEEEGDVQSNPAILASPHVPEPVFFCSVEAPSMSQQKQFDLALACLAREDPSLRVKQDPETGQTVLGGMGELHLEIVADRMRTDWKVEVELGKLEVAYREVPVYCPPQPKHHLFQRRLADKVHSVETLLSLEVKLGQGAVSELVWTREAQQSVQLRPQQVKLVEQGLRSGLESGPLLGYPLIDTALTIHSVQVGRGTSGPMLIAGCTSAVKELLAEAELRLAEPMMVLEVACEEDILSLVTQDIMRRRGQLYQMPTNSIAGGTLRVVRGEAPLAELRGYATELRTLTSGKANISMELSHYQVMSEYDQARAIQEVTGFAPS